MSGCGPGTGNAVRQTPVVQREFSGESMLVALHGGDFVYRQVELKCQAVNLLTRVPSQFELSVAESTRWEIEFRIKVVGAVNLADPAETVGSPNTVAVSPVVHGGSGIGHVPENERAIGLILKAHDDVDDLQVALRTGAKVGNRRGKVIGFVAEWLVVT